MEKTINPKTIIEILIEPLIYTITGQITKEKTKVRTNLLITIIFPLDEYLELMNEDYAFAELQYNFYEESKIMLDSYADWDHEKYTITFWGSDKRIQYIPTVEEYFNLLNQYNH